MKVSASLVLFHNDPEQYGLAIQSYLDGCDGLLLVVDNSATPLQHELLSHPRVHHVYTGKNLGFGKAHNLAIAHVGRSSDLHLILNPDIVFKPDVLVEMVRYFESNPDAGVLMPRIVYPDGRLQKLCKLLPNPMDLIFRRFILSKTIKERINRRYELEGLSQDRPSIVPSLSGCFLLARTDLLLTLGGFDERFFMYMEDVDLVRRVGDVANTVYFPLVQVVHAYAKGSYRNRKLLMYHLRSAVLYFFKWGWFFDENRSERNRVALMGLEKNKKI